MVDRPTPPNRTFNFGRFSRTMALWLLILLVPILLLQMSSASRDDIVEISYSQLNEQLELDNIGPVEIIPDDQEVRGELLRPAVIEGTEVRRFQTMLPFDDPAPLVSRLEDKGVSIKGRKAKTSWTTILISALPWLLIFGFWIFFLRQMQSGGNRAFAFGRSKAKLLSGDTPKVTFADVAGADEAKVELEEIIEFLKDPQKFQRLGGRLPKGALLVGPPGTGKTLLAKAVAGEAGRPFFSMSGSDFVEMFVGVGASRVRDLFEQGKAHAPCIIFIDEIDAVGRHRGAGLGGGHDEREQTLNQLLVEMDGFESNDGVILLAATNRPDVLDPALLRPGRFDRQIVVDMPDVRGREMILKVHARKIPLADTVQLQNIARATPGLAGADLANIVNEAALLAARRNKQRVDMRDFEDAKDKLMLGIERKSLVLTEEERRLTAYHEAGHALVSMLIPGLDPVHKVTIVPRGRALGVTFSLPEEDRHNLTKSYILGRLAMAYGGRIAEDIVFGSDKVTTGASQDIQQATEMARRMVTQFGMSDAVGPIAVGEREEPVFLGRELTHRHEVSERTSELVDAEVHRILNEAYQRAQELIEGNLDKLHALAEALLERETLERGEVEAIMNGKPLPPAPEVPSPTTEPPDIAEGPAPAPAPKPVLGTPPPEPAGA